MPLVSTLNWGCAWPAACAGGFSPNFFISSAINRSPFENCPSKRLPMPAAPAWLASREEYYPYRVAAMAMSASKYFLVADAADFQRLLPQRGLQLPWPFPALRVGILFNIHRDWSRQRQGNGLGHIQN